MGRAIGHGRFVRRLTALAAVAMLAVLLAAPSAEA
jgi:hypothetical protein